MVRKFAKKREHSLHKYGRQAVLNTLPDHAWISNGISNQVVRQWQSLGQLDEQVGREWSFELVSDQSASLSVTTHNEV